MAPVSVGTAGTRADVVLRTDIVAVSERSRVGEPLEIRVTATNDSNDVRQVLLWNTPIETPLSAGIFAARVRRCPTSGVWSVAGYRPKRATI